MSQRLSVLTGGLTTVLFTVIGGTFLANGQVLFGGVLLLLGAVRAFVVLRVILQDRG